MNESINMLLVTVRQKDSLTHTKFIVLPDGRTFPRDNFDLARGWADEGLLNRATTLYVRRLAEGKKMIVR